MNWVAKLKKKVQDYLAKRKKYESWRTKKVSEQLKTAGLTDAEIKKLKGGK